MVKSILINLKIFTVTAPQHKEGGFQGFYMIVLGVKYSPIENILRHN